MQQATTVDQYISQFPAEVQILLRQVRATIQAAAPDAKEGISYAIPTYKLAGKNLVHFAAFQKHIGFYPTPAGIAAFEKELSAYKGAKGSVQFPLDKPLPHKLIRKMVLYRVKETTSAEQKRGAIK